MALLAHLAEDLRAAVLVGDVEAARVAHDAIGRLLGGEVAGEGSVIDLATERNRRDGGGSDDGKKAVPAHVPGRYASGRWLPRSRRRPPSTAPLGRPSST